MLFRKSNKNINDKINNQRDRFDQLNNKIEIWNNSLLEEKEKSIKENEQIITNIKEKRVIQSGNLNLLNMQRSVIPKSIKQAYLSIKELYGVEKCSALTKELINKIKP